MNYTKHTLQKIETLFEEIDYIVRYEKGSFQSGYCLVESRKIAIVSKFFETDGRINTLLDILDKIEVPTDILSEKSLKFLKQIRKERHANEGNEADESEVQYELALTENNIETSTQA
jgi:hypothetical protein